MIAVKGKMIKIITDQPENFSFNEILHELNFTAMINNGLHDSLEDDVISTEEQERH